MYVTDGLIAFDDHGYSLRERLLAHHRRSWATDRPGWDYDIESVDFPIHGAHALNSRKLGPDRYLDDAIARARAFVARVAHAERAANVQAIAGKGLAPAPSGHNHLHVQQHRHDA